MNSVTNSKNQIVGWIKDYRLLVIAFMLFIPLAIFEASNENLPNSIGEVPPEWLMDEHVNFAKTLTELYPNRSYGLFAKAYQASMCWDNGFRPTVCQSFRFKDLRDIRIALQRAIDQGGSADQEELFHFYAFLTIQMNEPDLVVEDAIRRWRKHYPYSTKPDPRLMPRVR